MNSSPASKSPLPDGSPPAPTIGALALALVVFSLSPCLGADSQPERKDAAATEIDFNRDIRPILSDKCFFCHGPDAKNQKSEFRLDTAEHAFADLGGYAGIVPGKPGESELHHRIRTADADDLMPPADSNRTLSEHEKDLLDAWIEQGAQYDRHWAFKRVERPPLPALSKANAARVKNPIDRFVFARLEAEGLSPSPEADMETLLRRASLTLTGLPPAPAAIDAALAGAGNDPQSAYDRFVDDLLGTTGYAERQALRWLDAARFADTDGYQNDAERKNWPWRDWVIKAFHENMPFDQFTVEQLAGDLLPDATPSQILASAFNRNHRQNSEGGVLAEEFFVENVIDRVETTSAVWLGLTMGCARCHDHKYDPITQREFYQLFAYFNNIGERGTGPGVRANPVVQMGSPIRVAPPELAGRRDAAEARLKQAKVGLDERAAAWAEKVSTEPGDRSALAWYPADVNSAEASNGVTLKQLGDGSYRAGGKRTTNTDYTMVLRVARGREPTLTGLSIDVLPDPNMGEPLRLAPSHNGNFVLTEVEITGDDPRRGPPFDIPIAKAEATYAQPRFDAAHAIDGKPETGWAAHGRDPGEPAREVSICFTFAEPVKFGKQSKVTVVLRHQSQFEDHHIGRFIVNLSETPDPAPVSGARFPREVAAAVATLPDKRDARMKKVIVEHFETIDPALAGPRKQLAAVEREIEAGGYAAVPVMVMREKEGEPTPAWFLERGQYDAPDKSEALPRGVPAALLLDDGMAPPRDRLELARWLVSRDNPLTARVVVNRVWQDHFGAGLVSTPEDFGSQGRLPSHPGLLDWLAAEFMESGWDLKALHRLIVTSATYGQRSVLSPALAERDPGNTLFARGPRFRLNGFAIRDTALQAAGLLDERVGGPPVRPYQPEGLWNAVSGNSSRRYAPSTGADLYRRSLYTFWRRTVNPPRQLIFDASGRETCNVHARRTNTPLQALVLMNDVTFVESARHLAQRVLAETDLEADEAGAGDDDARLAAMFRHATALSADGPTLEVLRKNLAWFRGHFADRAAEAEAFLDAGESPRDTSIPAPEHAAWTMVAHLILNLDQTINVQ